MECRIAFLHPGQIRRRLQAVSLVYLPVGPLEWHGPHLPYGTDPINAEQVALAACRQTGGLVWPTLFWGTERERSPQSLKNLGFSEDQYIVGMDFPSMALPSAYCAEECFALVIRETFRQISAVGARRVAIINGHGAVNHNQVLERLATEFNRTSPLRIYLRLAAPRQVLATHSLGHAGSAETSLMMHHAGPAVDLGELPPPGTPLHYHQYAIVDGPGFDGRGRPDKIVEDDPRSATAEAGSILHQTIVREIAEEIGKWMASSEGA